MKTDALFYRLFETSPETFFLLLGMPIEDAKEMAARYNCQAIEFKETSHRVDGVFLPKEPELPLYFLEVQFYPLASVFAGLVVKVYTYLKQHDPDQPYFGVVLFASRNLEPVASASYRPLLEAGLIRRFYLDELPELANAPLGLSILQLIRQTESQAPEAAHHLVTRVRAEIGDEALLADLLEFIETVIMYKVPKLTREEIKSMLQLHDIRESRAYQESFEEGMEKGMEKGVEEGKKKGIEEGIEKGIEKAIAIARLAAEKKSATEIAALLQVKVELVRQLLEHADHN